MHPALAEYLEWDPEEKDNGNTAHLLRRGIRWWEVEQIFENDPEWRRDKNAAAGDYYMIGTTSAGRQLLIVVQVLDDERALRAITGWPVQRQGRRRR
jgi:hypothetical protein